MRRIQNFEKVFLENQTRYRNLSNDNSSFMSIYKFIQKQNQELTKKDENLDNQYYINNSKYMKRNTKNIFNYSIILDKKFGREPKVDVSNILKSVKVDSLNSDINYILNVNNDILGKKLSTIKAMIYQTSKPPQILQ